MENFQEKNIMKFKIGDTYRNMPHAVTITN